MDMYEQRLDQLSVAVQTIFEKTAHLDKPTLASVATPVQALMAQALGVNLPVSYLPGSKNVRVDALTRQHGPDLESEVKPVPIIPHDRILATLRTSITSSLGQEILVTQAEGPSEKPLGKCFVAEPFRTRLLETWLSYHQASLPATPPGHGRSKVSWKKPQITSSALKPMNSSFCLIGAYLGHVEKYHHLGVGGSDCKLISDPEPWISDYITHKHIKLNRSSSVEIVPEGSQIVVQVGREEKIICGLTKYTTCSEIIQAITEDHAAKTGCNSFLLGHHREYCIVEKWGDFERILLPCTKILKLCKAWGTDQINVNFELVKVDAHLHLPLWICDETKITNSLERNYEFNLGPKIQTLPLDKRKRIIRKAFRKLEKMKKGIDFQDKNNLESCINTVVSQDHTIKQQIQRIEELDREIEFKEACLLLEKMDSIRENYDQNPYLKSSDPYTKNSKNKTENIFPEHKKIQNELIHLEEQLNHLQALIRNLSDEIEEEISSTCMEIDKERDYSDGDENKLEECDVKHCKATA
ncbi:ras association domain-containing protein 9 [Rhinophrynus dorsalis]